MLRGRSFFISMVLEIAAMTSRLYAEQRLCDRPKHAPASPFILVAPQVSDPDQSWLYPNNRSAAMGILNEVLRKYHGDPARVYLAGISMGGWGAWFFAYSFPDCFAAIAPLCGLDADLRWAPQITRTPVWAFHGTNDNVASIIETERMITELQKLGSDPKHTPVIGGDHDIAKAVYSRDDLYIWFLQHVRSTPGSASPQ